MGVFSCLFLFVYLWVFFNGWGNSRIITIRFSFSVSRYSHPFKISFRRSGAVRIQIFTQGLMVDKSRSPIINRLLSLTYSPLVNFRALTNGTGDFQVILSHSTLVTHRAMYFRRFVKGLRRHSVPLFAMANGSVLCLRIFLHFNDSRANQRRRRDDRRCW